MPLSCSGKLDIVSSYDLGSLGAKDGPSTSYTWTMPSIAPLLFPWLAVVGLLTLKSNRRAQAWLIWLPIGLAFVLANSLANFLPSGLNILIDLVFALVLGLGAVWLLSDHLKRSHRILTCLLTAVVFGAFGLFAGICKSGADLSANTAGILVILGFDVLATCITLLLLGLICRKRYRPLGIYFFSLLIIAGIWLLVLLPFFLIAMISSNSRMNITEFLTPWLTIVGISFGILVPFLLLSSANSFYRERFKKLLHIEPEAPPILPTPPQNTN